MSTLRRVTFLAVMVTLVVGTLAVDAQSSLDKSTRAALGRPSAAPAVIPIPDCIGINLLIRLGSEAFDLGYGESRWVQMTAAIDATAASVTTTTDIGNLEFVLGFDALWIDLGDSGPGLSGAEIDNILAFHLTGKRVVMFGENGYWEGWDNQLLNLGGGSYGGDFGVDPWESTGVALGHELTAGVSSIYVPAGGIAIGGTPLFNDNVVTLWDPNVVTILDTNVVDDGFLAFDDNDQFAANLIDWMACGPVIPVELESFEVE